MNPEAIKKVSEFSLQQARNYSATGLYGRALAHFLVYIELVPQRKFQIENEFTSVLFNWSSKLENESRYDDLFKCFQQALEHYPNNLKILIDVGCCLMRLSRPTEASLYFEKALLVNKDHIPSSKFLQYAKYALVERWHFRMLNDCNRNNAFKNGIEKAISKGHNLVLDIGTGTGIFSVFASRSKAVSITACDASLAMIDTAKKVLKANNISNVKILPMLSDNIKIPSDISQRVSLLFTEIFDSGVFGEHVLETLLHAWENLLLPFPRGIVVPASVDIFVVAVECEDLSVQHRVNLKNLGNLTIDGINVLGDRREPYDTENMKDCRNVKYLTEPCNVWHVNFNNVNQLKDIIQGNSVSAKLTAISDGNIDAFVGWFSLNIDDEITLNNAPTNTVESCWDQMIFFVDTQLKINCKQKVDIFLSCIDGALKLFYSHTTEHSSCKIPLATVKFLNDSYLMNALENLSDELATLYNTNISILDLSPFPFFGLSLLKQINGKLTCKCENESVKVLVRKLCISHNIKNPITFIKSQHDIAIFDFDIVLTNVFDVRGDICDQKMKESSLLKTILKPGSLFLPQKIYLWVQVIQSNQLEKLCRVNDENTCGCKLADNINYYQSREHFDLSIGKLKFQQLSDPVMLSRIVFSEKNKTFVMKKSVRIQCTGIANAILYWFEVKFLDDVSWSTKDINSYINNAAFILDNPKSVYERHDIELKVEQVEGLFHISIQ